MGKKTMVPIEKSKYKIIKGYTSGGSSTANSPVTLTFDSPIIAVFFKYYSNRDSLSNGANGYYVNPNREFWFDESNFDNTYPNSNPLFYVYNTAYNVRTDVIDDYSITVKFSNSNTNTGHIYYTAILENNTFDDPIFLLNGTTLYTDGTPTSNVSGAIQTLDTDKYKIKSNALVNIAGATYANISN